MEAKEERKNGLRRHAYNSSENSSVTANLQLIDSSCPGLARRKLANLVGLSLTGLRASDAYKL